MMDIRLWGGDFNRWKMNRFPGQPVSALPGRNDESVA
jgi:hypothetical protein